MPKTVTPETAIKNSIKSYLNLKGYFFYHNLQGLGSARGLADLTILKDGKVYWVEVKRPGGKQSDYQKLFQQHIEDEGGIYIVATSVQDLIDRGI
uniref:Putative VRR-NUC domain-containing protein n=1 Tax=viral metagenome TaxID=1070528 RepID=A0A6H1ZA54_9ZZZZ